MKLKILVIVILLCTPLTLASSHSPLLSQHVVTSINTSVSATSPSQTTELIINNTWVPQPHTSQDIQNVILNTGRNKNNNIVYRPGSTPFSDTTRFTIKSTRNEPSIQQKVSFPLQRKDLPQQHLQFTELIDQDEDVRRIANNLARGEDDLFKLVSKTAEWVTTNIEYDLSTANIEASNPSTAVLKNRNGVCDELTNLFISLLRSNGIPARFVAGYSYTDSDLFDNPWGAHGWAEVYFPGHGWVPYDPTYGQYGYVDASHIVFAEGAQGERPQTTYSWRGRTRVNLETDIAVSILEQIPHVKQTMQTSTTHPDKVGLGSTFNIEHTVYNPTPSYYTTSLQLSRMSNTTIKSPESQTITIPPKQQETVTWTVKIDEGLDPYFRYDLPFRVYDKRTNTSTLATVSTASLFKKQTVSIEREKENEEENTTCTIPKPVYDDETLEITCESITPQKTCFNNHCTDLKQKRTIHVPAENVTTSTVELTHSKSTTSLLPVTITPAPQISIQNQTISVQNADSIQINKKAGEPQKKILYNTNWVPEGNHTVSIEITYTDLRGEEKTKTLSETVSVKHRTLPQKIKGILGGLFNNNKPEVQFND